MYWLDPEYDIDPLLDEPEPEPENEEEEDRR